MGVVNATLAPQTVKLDLKSIALKGVGRKWVMSGASLEARNKVGAAPGVTITQGAVRAGQTVAV